MKTLTVSSEGFGVKWGKTVIDYLIKLALPHVEIKYEMSLDCDVIAHILSMTKLYGINNPKNIYIGWENHTKYSITQKHLLITYVNYKRRE